ncbi:transposable element Tc1 transposase [Trichonephila clavipes]|nr:transposable element Tc1 transposase [Trichonephila clavipes]
MDSIPKLSSDHNPVFLNFSLTSPIHQDNARAVTTCWSDFRNNLKSSVHLSDFSGIRNPNVLEDKISFLTAAICSAHQQASKPIENKKHSFTPNHIHELIYIKNKAKRLYNRTLNPIHRTNYYKAQANLKKALKKHSQQSWQTRLESLNTTDNSLWQCQKFFRKKRSSIPNLISSSGHACSDDQKANLLAITLKDNFTENERPNGDYPIDNTITTTLENFSLTPHPFPLPLLIQMKFLTILKLFLTIKPQRGRKSIPSDVAKRKVLKDIKIDPKLSAVKLAAETSRIMGRSVSAETVRNVIRHAGYSSRVARKKPFISLQNQKKHLEFAKTHQLKTDNFWKKVIFSDESKFNIFGSDGRRTVWRKPNTALDPKNLRPTVKHGGGSFMVWGCMASNGVGN